MAVPSKESNQFTAAWYLHSVCAADVVSMVLHQRMHGVRVSEAVECNHADLVIMLHYKFAGLHLTVISSGGAYQCIAFDFG
mgnify:CR=1 FL=1